MIPHKSIMADILVNEEESVVRTIPSIFLGVFHLQCV